jgi:hypothetical protein
MGLAKSMIQSGEILGIIKKLDPKFKKEFESKKAVSRKSNSNLTFVPQKKKKQARPRPNRQLRLNPGRRSFLEGDS